MFTGIVEEMGRLAAKEGNRFTFSADIVTADAEIGGSIAVSGCCLTVIDFGPRPERPAQSGGRRWWQADVVDETLARTTLGSLADGDPVNLERPVRLTDRLGGHLVQGHVDGVGEVLAPAPVLVVRPPSELLRYIVEKGSIAVDGCSLTVAGVSEESFTVAVIPHTAEVTTLGAKRAGDWVNLEVDLMAKYAEKLLGKM